MKQLTCEMCGSTELLKQEGIFVCQTCGTKYSVEEAKKMMVEGTVEVTGTVQVDQSNNILAWATRGYQFLKDQKIEKACEYIEQILDIDPYNPDANLMQIMIQMNVSEPFALCTYSLDDIIEMLAYKGDCEILLDILTKEDENGLYDRFFEKLLYHIGDTEGFETVLKRLGKSQDDFSVNMISIGLNSILFANGEVLTKRLVDSFFTGQTNIDLSKQWIKSVNEAFVNNPNVVSVTLPYTVRKLEHAFINCNNLTTIKGLDLLYLEEASYRIMSGCNKFQTFVINDKEINVTEVFKRYNDKYTLDALDLIKFLKNKTTESQASIKTSPSPVPPINTHNSGTTKPSTQFQSSSGGCYVATCVYGSYDCPEVWTLRRYRDNTLGSTWYGRAFIRLYYAISPTLVKWFGKTKWFKKMWKGKLDRMVEKLQADGVENTPYEDKTW